MPMKNFMLTIILIITLAGIVFMPVAANVIDPTASLTGGHDKEYWEFMVEDDSLPDDRGRRFVPNDAGKDFSYYAKTVAGQEAGVPETVTLTVHDDYSALNDDVKNFLRNYLMVDFDTNPPTEEVEMIIAGGSRAINVVAGKWLRAKITLTETGADKNFCVWIPVESIRLANAPAISATTTPSSTVAPTNQPQGTVQSNVILKANIEQYENGDVLMVTVSEGGTTTVLDKVKKVNGVSSVVANILLCVAVIISLTYFTIKLLKAIKGGTG